MKPFHISDERFKKIIAETSNRLLQQHFGGRIALTGEDIVEFSPISQVNRFILFQIYQEWILQTAKLSSPYFDFKNPEVKQALQGFKNFLSGYIRVEKKEFKTLLDKSVYNSLRLIVHPNDVFANFFFLNQDSIALSHIEQYAPYFSDFDFMISGIISYHKKHGLEKVEKKIFFEKVNRVIDLYEQRVGHSIDSYRSLLFHKLTGLEISQVQTPPPNEEPDADAEPPSALAGILTKFERLKNDPPYPVNEIPNESISFMEQPTHTPEPAGVSSGGSINHIPASVHPTRTADRFEPQTQTVLNSIPEPPTGNVNQNLVKQSSVQNRTLSAEQIPMHKQFQYIARVFAGNRNKMQDTLQAINGMNDYSEVEQYILTRVLNLPEVDPKDPVVQDFLQMIKSAKGVV